MPGYPDNINRASDGNYWMAWLGMRTPSFDLALRHPGMRKRMTRRLPQDEWLFPNINTGGVVKFNENGRHRRGPGRPHRPSPSDGHLDARAQGLSLSSAASSTTASAATISRGADPSWTGPAPTGERRAMILDPILDLFRGKAITIPPMDGASGPTRAGRGRVRAELPTPDNLLLRWQAARSIRGSADLLAAARAKRPSPSRRYDVAGHRAGRLAPAASWRSALDDGRLHDRRAGRCQLPAGIALHHGTCLRRR